MGGVRTIHFCILLSHHYTVLAFGVKDLFLPEGLSGAQRLHVFEFVLQEVNLLLGQLCGALSILALGVAVSVRKGSGKSMSIMSWCVSGVQVVYHLILCTTQYHLTITWPIEPQVGPHQLWSQFTIGDFSKSLTQLKQCSFQLLDLKASLGVEKSSGLQHGNQLQMADSSSDQPSPYQYKQDTVLTTQLAGKKGS